jgi:DNA-binding XRE family transcriptional regulator
VSGPLELRLILARHATNLQHGGTGCARERVQGQLLGADSGVVDIVRLSRVRRQFRSGRARRMREGAALSVRELASRIEVDPSTLSRWERGATTPSPEGALAWAAAMEELGLRP